MASGSGLDPDITVDNARYQLKTRIARAQADKIISARVDRLFAAGRQHPVPLIVGNTRDEMSLFLLSTKIPADQVSYERKLREDFGELAAVILERYPAWSPGEVLAAVRDTRRPAVVHGGPAVAGLDHAVEAHDESLAFDLELRLVEIVDDVLH